MDLRLQLGVRVPCTLTDAFPVDLETLREILPRLKKKVILDEKARGVLPLLQLQGPVAEAKP